MNTSSLLEVQRLMEFLHGLFSLDMYQTILMIIITSNDIKWEVDGDIYIYVCMYIYIYISSTKFMEVCGFSSKPMQATMTPSGIPIYHLVNIQKTMENHNFQWANQLFLWPFSIAMLVYQRVLHF